MSSSLGSSLPKFLNYLRKTPTYGLWRQLTKPITPHVLAGICFVCLLLTTSWLWIETRERFPRLPQGTYVGTIEGIFDNASTRFFVESSANDNLYLIVLRSDWLEAPGNVSRIAMVPKGDDSPELRSRWLYPIGVQGPSMRLTFTGNKLGSGSFAGIVKSKEGIRGHWRLTALTQLEADTAGAKLPDLEAWLRLTAELDQVNRQVISNQELVDKQKKEIDVLTEFVTERERLKARADQKVESLTAELQKAKQELHKLQEEARNLEKQVNVSQRVTAMGTLVSLSRESLDREARWIESMLRSDGTERNDEFQMALERAYRITAVKRQIAVEREQIFRIQETQRGDQTGENSNSAFDSVWKGN